MEDIQRLLAIDVSQITLRGIGPMKLPKPTAFIGTDAAISPYIAEMHRLTSHHWAGDAAASLVDEVTMFKSPSAVCR
jgi:hypothetical protein